MNVEDLDSLRESINMKSQMITDFKSGVHNKISELEKKMIQYLTKVQKNSIEFSFHYKWYRYEISIRLVDDIGDPEHINNTKKRLLIVISKRDITNHLNLGSDEYYDLRSIPKPEILTKIIDKSIEYIKKNIRELEEKAKELDIEYNSLEELSHKLDDDIESFDKKEDGLLKRASTFSGRIRKKKENDENTNQG